MANTPNYNLTTYSPADTDVRFLDFRVAIAGSQTTSNFYKIDTALKQHADAIASLEASQSAYTVKATYSTDNFYTASVVNYPGYETNQLISLSLDRNNVGTVTININSSTTKSVMKYNTSGLLVNMANNDFVKNNPVLCIYDGTQFIAIGSSSATNIRIDGTANQVVMISGQNTLVTSGRGIGVANGFATLDANGKLVQTAKTADNATTAGTANSVVAGSIVTASFNSSAVCPTATKTSQSLTVQFNGTAQATFNGSAAKTVNITPDAIGAISKNAIQLTNEDLNDIRVDVGFYYAGGGNSVTNTPPNFATLGFGMRCERLARGYYLQTFSSSGFQYKRYFSEKGWNDWQPIYSGFQKPTASDVGAIPTSGGNFTGPLIGGADDVGIRWTSDDGTTFIIRTHKPGNEFNIIRKLSDGTIQRVMTVTKSIASFIGNSSTANQVNNNLVVKLNSGTSEGTNMFTFNGSSAKSVNITPASINAFAKTDIIPVSNGGTGGTTIKEAQNNLSLSTKTIVGTTDSQGYVSIWTGVYGENTIIGVSNTFSDSIILKPQPPKAGGLTYQVIGLDGSPFASKSVRISVVYGALSTWEA